MKFEFKLQNLFAMHTKHHDNILVISITMMIFLFFCQNIGFSQTSQDKKIPDTYCLNEEELQLFNMINQQRQQKGLPKLELSKSLSYVAYLHVRDLYINRPDSVKGCNMHSWSNKGNGQLFAFRKNKAKNDRYGINPKN
jgi:hypothetical protein